MGENTLRARALRAREILTGESRDRGLLKWFQDEMEDRTGFRPVAPTVFRWFHDPPKRDILASPEGRQAVLVLEALETKAKKVAKLQKKIEEVV